MTVELITDLNRLNVRRDNNHVQEKCNTTQKMSEKPSHDYNKRRPEYDRKNTKITVADITECQIGQDNTCNQRKLLNIEFARKKDTTRERASTKKSTARGQNVIISGRRHLTLQKSKHKH